MKNKNILKLMVLTGALLFGVKGVYATDICYTNKTYYLGYVEYSKSDNKANTNNFTKELDVSTLPYLAAYETAREMGIAAKYHDTEFTLDTVSVPTSSMKSFDILKQGAVCLTKDGKKQNAVGNNEAKCIKTWTMDDYDSAVQGILENERYVHKISNYGTTLQYEYTNAGIGAKRQFSTVYFPTKTRFDAQVKNGNMHLSLNTYITFSESDFSDFSDDQLLFAPNVYYLEYKYCVNKPTYNKIQVNFYYEGTTDYVEFENEAEANPYIVEYNSAPPTVTINYKDVPLKNKTCKMVDDGVIRIENPFLAADNDKGYTDYTVLLRTAAGDTEYEHYTTTKNGNGEDVEVNIYYRCSDTGTSSDDEDYSKAVESHSDEGSGIKVTYNEDNNPKVSDESNEDGNSNGSSNSDGKQSVVDKIADTIANNPKTGTAMVIFAWIVAMGALGYSVYYFKNQKQDSDL